MQNIALDIIAGARSRPDAVALRFEREGSWRETTYATMVDRIDRVAAVLVGLGVNPGDRVGIFSPNLPEWIIADYGVMSIQGVSVPIYATSTADQASVIVADSGMRVLFVGTEAERDSALEILGACPELETVIAMTPGLADGDGRIFDLANLEAAAVPAEVAEDIARRRQRATSGDLATIIYTSGTTGVPKGVLLRHTNFVNQFTTMDNRFVVGEKDRSLCFLPLSHVYERTWSAYVFLKGASNTILSNPRQVVTAIADARPTVMVSAPRLYEKVHAAIHARVEAAPAYRQKLFGWAIAVGDEYWRARYAAEQPAFGLKLKHAVADALVLKKIRNAVGGPKNFFSSGGAALDKHVEDFFLSVGLLICQGYGLTETAPMLTCNAPGAFRFGTVGRPIDGVEIRIAETGEIQVKGPNVTEGYFGKPEATAECFIDGWFKTGDIGHLDEEGYLVITDRIKDLIVTAGGKNVAPQHIESVIGKDHYIDQLAVVGDKRKFISAIVVPAFESLLEFAKERKLAFQDHDELIRLPEVVELYRKRIKEQSLPLAPFEKVKRFTLVAKQFSMQAGEITPTLKIRRKVVAEKYRELIERMYKPEPSESD